MRVGTRLLLKVTFCCAELEIFWLKRLNKVSGVESRHHYSAMNSGKVNIPETLLQPWHITVYQNIFSFQLAACAHYSSFGWKDTLNKVTAVSCREVSQVMEEKLWRKKAFHLFKFLLYRHLIVLEPTTTHQRQTICYLRTSIFSFIKTLVNNSF